MRDHIVGVVAMLAGLAMIAAALAFAAADPCHKPGPRIAGVVLIAGCR